MGCYEACENTKDSHIFPQKQQWISNIYVINFYKRLTYDVVNFEQPIPVLLQIILIKAQRTDKDELRW